MTFDTTSTQETQNYINALYICSHSQAGTLSRIQCFLGFSNMQTLVLYSAVSVLMMALGAAGALAWSKKHIITELWQDDDKQWVLEYSDKMGPATYVVHVDDYAVLESVALSRPDIMGVEMYEFPDKAAIAFNTHDASSIKLINEVPGVRRMELKDVPMLCHSQHAKSQTNL